MTVREGLQRLEGVESVGERAEIKAQTCQIKTKNGQLLDLRLLAIHLVDIGVGARLRGVEATIDGVLTEHEGWPALLIDGWKDPIRLMPLTQIVQLDYDKRRARVPHRQEWEAYLRLAPRVNGKSQLQVEIVGPLVQDAADGKLRLQVRQFRMNPQSISKSHERRN